MYTLNIANFKPNYNCLLHLYRKSGNNRSQSDEKSNTYAIDDYGATCKLLLIRLISHLETITLHCWDLILCFIAW